MCNDNIHTTLKHYAFVKRTFIYCTIVASLIVSAAVEQNGSRDQNEDGYYCISTESIFSTNKHTRGNM